MCISGVVIRGCACGCSFVFVSMETPCSGLNNVHICAMCGQSRIGLKVIRRPLWARCSKAPPGSMDKPRPRLLWRIGRAQPWRLRHPPQPREHQHTGYYHHHCLGELMWLSQTRFSRGELLHTRRCEIRTISHVHKRHYRQNTSTRVHSE